jgi:hypothetical protein
MFETHNEMFISLGRSTNRTSLSLFPVAPTLVHGASVKRFVSLQFLNLTESREDSSDEGSARHKAATYTGHHKHRINADKHPCLE